MKILKIILIAVVAIFILFLGVGLFLPFTSYVKCSITINIPADSVFALVVDYNYYHEWDPWSKMDPSAIGKISGSVRQDGQKCPGRVRLSDQVG